jgi:hypothetical protein
MPDFYVTWRHRDAPGIADIGPAALLPQIGLPQID